MNTKENEDLSDREYCYLLSGCIKNIKHAGCAIYQCLMTKRILKKE
jgi:hypothetical protein